MEPRINSSRNLEDSTINEFLVRPLEIMQLLQYLLDVHFLKVKILIVLTYEDDLNLPTLKFLWLQVHSIYTNVFSKFN